MNGLTIQWFRATIRDTYYSAEYKFPTAFSNACFYAAGTIGPTESNNNFGTEVFIVRSLTKTGFTGRLTWSHSNSVGVASEPAIFIAYGY